jgi:hypothetical protein
MYIRYIHPASSILLSLHAILTKIINGYSKYLTFYIKYCTWNTLQISYSKLGRKKLTVKPLTSFIMTLNTFSAAQIKVIQNIKTKAH